MNKITTLETMDAQRMTSLEIARVTEDYGVGMDKGMWAKFFAHIGKGRYAAGRREADTCLLAHIVCAVLALLKVPVILLRAAIVIPTELLLRLDS